MIVWTAETDPNKLLGRPFQYTSKVTFRDTRLPLRPNPRSMPADVEVFATAADLQSRKTYIESVIKTSPQFVQYVYSANLALLRLGKGLTPDQAAAYEAAFAKAAASDPPVAAEARHDQDDRPPFTMRRRLSW
ncbi:MAG: hypothetical protein U0232_14560 [Thermomicrobiales bacterium]